MSPTERNVKAKWPGFTTDLLRGDGEHADRVSFLELFFDLVFVFAVTQISHTLVHSIDDGHALDGGLRGLEPAVERVAIVDRRRAPGRGVHPRRLAVYTQTHQTARMITAAWSPPSSAWPSSIECTSVCEI